MNERELIAEWYDDKIPPIIPTLMDRLGFEEDDRREILPLLKDHVVLQGEDKELSPREIENFHADYQKPYMSWSTASVSLRDLVAQRRHLGRYDRVVSGFFEAAGAYIGGEQLLRDCIENHEDIIKHIINNALKAFVDSHNKIMGTTLADSGIDEELKPFYDELEGLRQHGPLGEAVYQSMMGTTKMAKLDAFRGFEKSKQKIIEETRRFGKGLLSATGLYGGSYLGEQMFAMDTTMASQDRRLLYKPNGQIKAEYGMDGVRNAIRNVPIGRFYQFALDFINRYPNL